eukprot:10065997-Alexandrium_andersonii.AAC.1
MPSAVCLCGAPPPVPCSYHAAEQTRRGEARPASAGTKLKWAVYHQATAIRRGRAANAARLPANIRRGCSPTRAPSKEHRTRPPPSSFPTGVSRWRSH